MRDTTVREGIANALIHLDSTHEEACRALIHARADRGDYGGALRLYRGLWDLLGEEFDVEPSMETQELVVRIRNSMTLADQAAVFRAAPEPEVPGTADHAPDSIALPPIELPKNAPSLPAVQAVPAMPLVPQRNMIITVGGFDTSGTAPDQRYVVHGFRHELVASLVRFREWVVRDDMTGGGQTPAPTEGMGSEYRVDATAVSGPDSIRLILTLRDPQTGMYIWSDRYAVTLAAWHEAQQAIIRRIAVTLNVHLSANRLNRLSNEPDVSLDVFDRWLRAQSMIHMLNASDWERAEEVLRGTITEAPKFSPGFSSLAQLQNAAHIAYPGVFRSPDIEREGLDLARNAVKLDPVDSRAQLCLGWAYAMSHNFSAAELHMGLAVDLNDNDPWTLMSTALFFAFDGHADRARTLSQRATELVGVPTRSHWVFQSTIEFMRGDYDSCVTSSLSSGDSAVSNLAWRASAYANLGRQTDAMRALGKFFEATRRQWRGTRPTEQEMLSWLLHLYPIRDPADWQRLTDGLAKAGADISGIEYGVWPSDRDQKQSVIV